MVPFDDGTQARSLVVTTRQLTQVDATSASVAALTQATGAGQLTVDRSADASELGKAISGTVGSYGVMIVATVMGTPLATLALLSVLMVHPRRQASSDEGGSGTALAQVPSAVAAGLRDPVRVLRTP
jgi:hypothetical protein